MAITITKLLFHHQPRLHVPERARGERVPRHVRGALRVPRGVRHEGRRGLPQVSRNWLLDAQRASHLCQVGAKFRVSTQNVAQEMELLSVRGHFIV